VNVHTRFDIAAAITAGLLTTVCYFWRLRPAAKKIEHAGAGYAVALVSGAAVGGYLAGTVNLWISGEPGTARSIIGALAGAITAIEVYKRAYGISGSTGLAFVPGFATTVVIGRWGCFFSGLTDHTHGIATELPWGHNFGDGVSRHPVQLYESAAMTVFLVYALVMLARRDAFFMRTGFYQMVLWYASQRFCWEFFKPYGAIVGPLNLFQVVCLGLIAYSVTMMRRSAAATAPPETTKNQRGRPG